MTPEKLAAFERRVVEAFEKGLIRGPVHLSGGNETQLIEIFKSISREDWIFSTYRSHYHALLHGIPEDWLWNEILVGRSMNIQSPEHRFMTSAIVGGCLPIAVGVAAGIKRRLEERHVWCFVGDMAASIGVFHEARRYTQGHVLPLTFVIEDNGLSCDTPTKAVWGYRDAGTFYDSLQPHLRYYRYQRTYPHVGVGKFVQF